jgi:hypothetical protein
VWSYDFVEDRTHDGRKFRMLNVVDEFTHECLAIRVASQLKATDVIDVLSDLFILRGVPGWRSRASWVTAHASARAPLPSCSRIICSSTASAGRARATTRYHEDWLQLPACVQARRIKRE